MLGHLQTNNSQLRSVSGPYRLDSNVTLKMAWTWSESKKTDVLHYLPSEWRKTFFLIFQKYGVYRISGRITWKHPCIDWHFDFRSSYDAFTSIVAFVARGINNREKRLFVYSMIGFLNKQILRLNCGFQMSHVRPDPCDTDLGIVSNRLHCVTFLWMTSHHFVGGHTRKAWWGYLTNFLHSVNFPICRYHQ